MKHFVWLAVVSNFLFAEIVIDNFSKKAEPIEAVYNEKEQKISVRDKKTHKELISHKYEPMELDEVKKNSFDWGKFVYYDDFNFDGKKDIALIQNSDCLKGFGYKVYIDKNNTYVYDSNLSKIAQCFMFETDKKHKLYSVYDSVSKSNSYYVNSHIFGDPYIYKIGAKNSYRLYENYNHDKSYKAIFNRMFALIKDVKNDKFLCRVDDHNDELMEVFWSYNKHFAYIYFLDEYLVELDLKNCKRRNIIQQDSEIMGVIFNKSSTKVLTWNLEGELILTNLKTLKSTPVGIAGASHKIKKIHLSKSEKAIIIIYENGKTKQIKLPK